MLRSLLSLVAGAAVLAAPALAQDAGTPDAALGLRLDGLVEVEGACRLTFVAENGLAADITTFSVEAVAFDAEGGVARFSLFDFRDLPAGRMRVRQFDLPGMSCQGVGSVLVNGVQTCDGEGLDPAVCADGLVVSSRADVDLMG